MTSEEKATQKQLDLLSQLNKGLGETPDLTKKQASELITEILEAKNGKAESDSNRKEILATYEGVKKTNGEIPAVKIGMIEKLVLKHFSRRNEALPTAQAFIKTCNYMLALCNAWEESLK